MWNLKNKTNEQMKQKQTHRNTVESDDCQRGGKDLWKQWEGWEVQIGGNKTVTGM